MSHRLECQGRAVFSLDEKNPRVLEHVAAGGLGAVYEDGYISIYRNSYKLRVDRAADVPITLGGRARFNIENVLAATLAGYILPLADRRHPARAAHVRARRGHHAGPDEHLPLSGLRGSGRLRPQHRRPAPATASTCEATPAHPKRSGIVAGLGDRRDEDTITLGRTAGAAVRRGRS